jgi:two-component system, LytTR family, response regulator
MKAIRTVIVDDEPAAVNVIKALLRQFAPDLELAGVAENGLEAIKVITAARPNLIFLDVDMPVMNGLQVLEKLPEKNFAVIFTTGSSEYALKALKLNAIDYLLKPIDPADFMIAVEKAREHLSANTIDSTVTKIQLPAQNGIIYLNEADIMYVTGMGSYCQINTLKKEQIIISKNIGQLEVKLSTDKFFRCHNSYIVNLEYVSKFISRDGYSVEMNDGSIIEVSRRSKEKLLNRLSEKSK